jgi:hypothetical protein
LVALAPLALTIGCAGEWVEMPVVLMVEHHGSLGFVVKQGIKNTNTMNPPGHWLPSGFKLIGDNCDCLT